MTFPASASAQQSSYAPIHTYEMDADNLKEIGHRKTYTVPAVCDPK